MSATAPCVPCCSTPQVTNVPGVEGPAGTNGANGINAFTTLTGGGLTVPAVGSTVTATVANSQWCVVGQNVIAAGPANFLVTAVPSAVSVTLEFLGYPGDVAPTTVIAAGVELAPAGQRGGSSVNVTFTGVNLTLGPFNDVVLVTVDNKTITLPTAVGIQGKIYTIKQTATFSSGTTINTTSGQTIDGASTKTIGATNGVFQVCSDGSNWQILSKI